MCVQCGLDSEDTVRSLTVIYHKILYNPIGKYVYKTDTLKVTTTCKVN